MFTILNLLIMRKNCILNCRPTGDPWVSANPMGLGMGLGKILNFLRVWVFLMGSNIFHRFGFGMVKFDKFRHVVIPIRFAACAGDWSYQ